MSPLIHDEKQQQLQDELSALGSLVEDLPIQSVDLLKHSELEILERLGEEARQVHRKRLAIEMGCLSLIATRHPCDEELRLLVAMVEIAAELERIADHAQRVARVNYLVADQQLGRSLASIQRLARTVQSSLNDVLEAFVKQDLHVARSVRSDSREVYDLYEEAYQNLLAVMQSKPRIANQALYLSRAAYNLKRAAERVIGVCDWVIVSLTGTMGQAAVVQASQEDLVYDEGLLT